MYSMMWAPEEHQKQVDLGQHGKEQQRRREKELHGEPGVMYPLQWPTELVDSTVSRPYVPLGMKKYN